MILVDTSIWVEMFRRGRFKTELATLIGNDQLCTHPFVLAELACGYLPDREGALLELDKLIALPTISTADVRYMIETRGLFSKGIGFIDAQLIARASPRTARRSGPPIGLSAELRNHSAFAQPPRKILGPNPGTVTSFRDAWGTKISDELTAPGYAARGTRPDFTIILSCVRRRMPSTIAVAPMILSCGSFG